jgi:hypothetical protein
MTDSTASGVFPFTILRRASVHVTHLASLAALGAAS